MLNVRLLIFAFAPQPKHASWPQLARPGTVRPWKRHQPCVPRERLFPSVELLGKCESLSLDDSLFAFLRVDSFCLYTARSNYKAKLDVPSPSDIFKAYCFLEKLSSNPLFFNLRILVYTIYQNRSSPSYRTLILINIVYITVIQISVILRIQLGRCVWTSSFISSNVFLTTT